MKKLKYLGLLLLAVVPVTIAIFSSKMLEASAAATRDSIENAYGYKISIVTYNGSGDPIRQGKPILVVNPDMYGEITIPTGHAFPTSGEQFATTPWPGVQQQKPSNEQTGHATFDTSDPGAAGEYWGETEGHYPQGAQDNPNNDMSGCGEGCDDVVWEEGSIIGSMPDHTKDRPSGEMPKLEFIFRYSTDNRITTYDKAHIRYDDEYSIIEEDSNLTQYNIENNNYIRTLIERYTGTTVNGKFQGSRALIESNFQLTIDDSKIDQYYVQVEVVQRLLLDEFADYGAYSTKLIYDNPIRYIQDEMYALEDHGEDWCSNLPSSTKNKGSSMGYYCDPPGNTSCTKANCTVTETEDCKTCCTSEKCHAQDYELQYTPEAGEYTTENVYILTGHYAYGYSLITTSRSLTYNLTFMNRAVNSCDSEEGKHCVKSEDNENECVLDSNGNVMYEYYIGPNRDKALVGSSHMYSDHTYEYQLVGDSCNPGKSPEGIRHFYVEELIDCVDGCRTVCNPDDANYATCVRSDAFLKCAENYCENKVDYDTKGNARNRKKNCLVKNCKYRYGRDPETGSTDFNNTNLQSIDSCANSKQLHNDGYYNGSYVEPIVYNYDALKNITKFNSNCNVSDDGHYTPTPQKRGTNTEECLGDSVTDFDGDDTNETPHAFDQRTYINTICRETTSFNFTDTSKLNLSKGEGFEYPTNQNGNRECTYFINKEQWMFDYASIPGRDREYQRQRLLYILESFNKEVSGEAVDTSSYNSELISEISNEGKTNFQMNGYNFEKTNILVTINEKLSTESDSKEHIEAPKVEWSSITNPVDGNNLLTGVSLHTDKNEQVKLIANNENTKYLNINRYVSNAAGELKYSLKKVCVSTDGMASVYQAPDNNICYQTTIHPNVGVDELYTIYGESKYFTSYQIEPNKDNNVKTDVTVSKTGGTSTDYYYDVDEKCTYKVNEDNQKYRCKVWIKTEVGDSGKLGNKQYELDHVYAELDFLEIPSSLVVSSEMKDNNVVKNMDNYRIIITNDYHRSIQAHQVDATVTLKDGTTVQCEPADVELYHNNPICNIGCHINKIDDTRYELVPEGDATKYYTTTTYHDWPSVAEMFATNSIPYSYMKSIIGTVTNGKIYIKLDQPLQPDEYIYGYVTSNDPACNYYCPGPKNPPPPSSENDCYKLFAPAQTRKIRQYCSDNWEIDINDFNGEEDCFEGCANPCPNECHNKETIQQYCEDAYDTLGFDIVESCVNKCTCEIDDYKDEYLFRTINIEDPFPNSEESEIPYEKGKRIIGKNWRGLSEFITSDDGDQTSVTGINKNNQKVEYIIDMTAEDIRMIREDTMDSGYGQTNKRKVYAKLERITNGDNTIKEYKSSFINTSNFRSLFKATHGVGSSYIEAVFPKE